MIVLKRLLFLLVCIVVGTFSYVIWFPLTLLLLYPILFVLTGMSLEDFSDIAIWPIAMLWKFEDKYVK